VVTINLLIAGTTGKISGRIVDKETGEPLVGVNVTVRGTTLGAMTNLEGYYAILYVQPGIQTVVASMVGYAPVTITRVRVLIDQTAPVDIQMTEQAIETGAVIIVAERSTIKKDVSTSVVAMQPDEIEGMPVSSVNEMVGLQAGIEANFVVRGGTSDQLLFQIDGATQRDPRNNKPITNIALSSIQEISVERGGFNAEYGQVRSGIVNIVEKEGDISRYTGSITVKYSPAQQKHFGLSVYDPNSMWNRPYLDPDVCWVGTKHGTWDEYEQRQYPQFDGWNSISQGLINDGDPSNDLTPAGAQRYWEWTHRRRPAKEPDYYIDGSLGGPVPFISEKLGNLRFFSSFVMNREMLLIPLSRDDYKDYNLSFKLNSDVRKNMKLQLSATAGKMFTVPINENDKAYWNPTFGITGVQFWNPTDYMRTPLEIAEVTNEQRPSRIFTESWYGTAEVSHLTFAAKLTSFVTASTVYEVSFENVNTNYLTGPIHDRDTTRRYEIVPGYFVDEAPMGYNPLPSSDLSGMFFGGHSSTARDSSKLHSFSLKGDLTSQLTSVHMIKAGFDFSYYNLDLNYGSVNVFFQDVNYVKQNWRPYRFSFYAQDKIEALGFIANLGVRMDLSNPNTEWADIDPFYKAYFSSQYAQGGDIPQTKAKVDVALSPRLGISHPITENSKLYFNYGHFKQMPAYEEIFRQGRGAGGELRNYGNPNLVQAKTVSYELGYDHSLFDLYLLQLSAFYHDITDQQAYTAYLSDQKGIGYFEANNNSYADIRGFELTFRKAAGDWIRGFANFTYQVVTNGAFGKPTIDEDPSKQKIIDQNTALLYQQKPVPQPRANLSITFLTPEDFGPQFSGIRMLGDWTVNFIAEWRAGGYITYQQRVIPEEINNVQLSDYYNVDLRINKTFDFKMFSMMFFMEVRNLLNSQFLSGKSFYDAYDFQYYMASLHLPENRAYDNIPGTDRAGFVRKEGVQYQPIEQSGNVNGMNPADAKSGVIYYDRSTKQYMNYVGGTWVPVDGGRMDQVLEDKAYIDMPNNTSFSFLNPRQIFYGISLSFKL
jgi:outer membrane receptor protein involved in Fe transport